MLLLLLLLPILAFAAGYALGKKSPGGDKDDRLVALRHDIRGALAPALLSAERLTLSSQADIQRSGEIIERAIGQAVALLQG